MPSLTPMSSYMRQSFSRGAIPAKSLFGSKYFIGQTLVCIIFESVIEKKKMIVKKIHDLAILKVKSPFYLYF
jgi:hypothetical protein